MKKESGIALVTLVVYLMIVSTVLVVLTSLSSYVFKNINKLGSGNISSEEFNKFNVNFVKTVKENKTVDITNDNDNIIIGFGDGTIYNYISNEKSIYKNKIKIAKNINYFTAIEQNINNKNVIQIKIGTGKDSGNADNDFGKTINYVLKYW